MKTPQNYWFGILPHVFYTKKIDNILLYNTLTGDRINTTNPEVISLMEEIHEKKNLGIIKLSKERIINNKLTEFIAESINKNICKQTPILDENSPKPVQMMPVLNLQREVDKLMKESDRSIGEDLIHYLLNLNIQLNDNCNLNCRFCNSYYKQFPCCSSSESKTSLSLIDVESLLEQSEYASMRAINFRGGNILKYPHLKELLDVLEKRQIEATFGIHLGNCIPDQIILLRNFKKEVYITFPLTEICRNYLDQLIPKNEIKFVFAISSEEEYELAEQLVEKNKITNYDIYPFYNGSNLDFFEQNVYLKEEDIFAGTVKQRQIFANQKLNTNFFGTLYVSSDGNVYANYNTKQIGNIKDKSLLDLVYTEMTENTAWRVVRDQAPCNACTNQFICPSPSNYELIIGKQNLCQCYPSTRKSL